mmetsp:Transcript_58919/g.140352  ORF Transcript_58919/g.140352 Transcript_58919/m.140352 type:complete len:214 (+) Transcript_58919:315-956(+)
MKVVWSGFRRPGMLWDMPSTTQNSNKCPPLHCDQVVQFTVADSCCATFPWHPHSWARSPVMRAIFSRLIFTSCDPPYVRMETGLAEGSEQISSKNITGSMGATPRKYWLRWHAKCQLKPPPALKPAAKTFVRSTQVCSSTQFQIVSTRVTSLSGTHQPQASILAETKPPFMQHSSESHHLEQHSVTPPMADGLSNRVPQGRIPNQPWRDSTSM